MHVSLPVKDKTITADTMKKALAKTMDVLRVVRLYQQQMIELKKRTAQLEKTKKELEARIGDMEKFNKLVVGRELRMVELKSKIRELESAMKK